MNRRLAGLALVGLALAGCSRADAPTATDTPAAIGSASDASESASGRGRPATLEMAEGLGQRIGTLGEGCERGSAPRIGPPEANWNTATITAFQDSNDEPVFLPRGGARLRYPRDWGRASGDFFEVSHSGDAGRSEVEVSYMTTVPATEGTSPWDVRIQAMEEGVGLEATEALPLAGGRCLVVGQQYAGPAVVLLFPLGGDATLVASAAFIDSSDLERGFDEIPVGERDVALQILNSVELVEPPIIPAV